MQGRKTLVGRLSVSSRGILLFLLFGVLLSVATALAGFYRLSGVVSSEVRERELALLVGSIEAGPLAIARLQASAIAQQELTRLMTNPKLTDRGMVSAEIRGGESFSYSFAKWNSSEPFDRSCLSEYKQNFSFPDALNPFEISVSRDLCHQLSEARTILRYSFVLLMLTTLATLTFLSLSVWPVAQSLARAQSAVLKQYQDVRHIAFHPIRTLVRQAYRSVELERDQALSTVAAQVSHDIRSPLSALNIVVAQLQDIPDAHRELIAGATARINAIANDLLKQKIDMAAGDPSSSHSYESIVAQVVREKQLSLVESSRIQVSMRIDPGSSAKIAVNHSDLARILSNLINNSIEASNDSGKIVVEAKTFRKHVEIEVHDEGKGIPKDHLTRLDFHGISPSKPGTSSGTGLGLKHARDTVENALGRLEIRSKVGKGTHVRLIIPRIG